MKKVFLLLGLLILITSCTVGKEDSTKTCLQDSDCVPASCCHPTEAVNKQFAPDCAGTMCTMECAPNTLDCGQGEVKCVDKVCKAFLN